jgi:hypothetical protein
LLSVKDPLREHVWPKLTKNGACVMTVKCQTQDVQTKSTALPLSGSVSWVKPSLFESQFPHV